MQKDTKELTEERVREIVREEIIKDRRERARVQLVAELGQEATRHLPSGDSRFRDEQAPDVNVEATDDRHHQDAPSR